ncbi:MAG: hypothetical protein ACPG47_00625 [Leucothrix sp.]
MIKNKRSRNLINYLMVFLVLISSSVSAEAPAVGTVIKNQATATYKDSSGVEQTTTSNLVETVVQQVGAFLLEQDQSRYGIAGQVASFPHVLTNTGNGDDSFALTAVDILTTDDFNFTDIKIYPDTNQDGVADSNIAITSTGTLSADEAFYFVVSATVPASATNNQVGNLTVQGTSAFSSVIKTNIDTVTVSDKAVIRVTKSISSNSGQAGSGPYTVTLTYSNPSTVDATDVTLIDALPSGMTYVPGSGRWGLLGSGSVLTDSDKTDTQGIATETVIYCAYDATCTGLYEASQDADSDSTNQVTAIIATVVSGDSGTITFSVNLDASLSASTLTNIGEFSYNDGTAVITDQNTNEVPIEVLSQPGVVANGSTSSNVDGTGESVTQTVATLGSTVAFDNVIWNTGNDTDIFDISVNEAGATFPPGTTFTLYKSDGFTPLLDNDNSGEVDTGPLAAGGFYVVVLKARLPMTGSAVGNAGYDVTKTATSAIDPSVSNSVTDHLDEITGSDVDLTNNAAMGNAAATGVGPGPLAVAQTTINVAPKSSGVFMLYVNNTSTVADSFDLTYSKDDPFVAGTLPAMWAVSFHADGGANDCSVLGPVINNTSIVAPSSSKLICAQVSIAEGANFSNSQVSIYFRVSSPLTGASDIKHDAVFMTAVKKLILEPDSYAQTEPSNSVVYTHRLNNPGNTPYTGLTLASTDTLSADGWSSTLYEDTDGDGVLTVADLPVGSYTLNPGETRVIFAKVFAPAGATYGATNVTDISATGSTNTGVIVVETVTAQDRTTVAKSNMNITKRQAPDVDCNGTADSAFSFNAFQAKPDTCVLYNLTTTNNSTYPTHNVRIDDLIPEFTSHFTALGTLPTISVGAMTLSPADGSTGLIGGNAGTVQPGGSVTLIFGVRVE